MELLLFYLFIALGFSFLCSLLEAIILSITPSFIGAKIQEGRKYGFQLQKLKDDIDKPLAAILTLNTFAHTLGAAGVGAQAQLIWGSEYISIISIALTIAILILSEIIPKTLGAVYWRQLAGLSSHILKFFITTLYPFVIVSRLLTKLLRRKKERSVEREDVEAMSEIGYKEGVIGKDESAIITNLLRLNKLQAKYIMTPRTVVRAAEEKELMENFYKENHKLEFSRIPVYIDSIDNITGFILKDELLENIIGGNGKKPLREIRRNINIVYEGLPVFELFRSMIKNNTHISAAANEYGGIEGIITIEDILETLLGLEIMDETDNIEDLQKMAKEKWNRKK
jgi:CBS domain containing-hemolysin-like protein